MILSLIAAIGNQGQIGNKGKIPWHLPEELQHFKRLTMGHHLLMGRKTFQSLPGVLPGRPHLILSRQPPAPSPHPRCHTLSSLKQALERAREAGETELFVCGGADLYAQTLPLADRLYLSRIDYSGPADTFFPPWNHLPFEPLSTDHNSSFECLTYQRKRTTIPSNE